MNEESIRLLMLQQSLIDDLNEYIDALLNKLAQYENIENEERKLAKIWNK